MSVTRIAKLKGFDNVLMGRDIANIFIEGHVYDIQSIMGHFIVKDLGEHSQMDDKYEGTHIAGVAKTGLHCLTKSEYENKKP